MLEWQTKEPCTPKKSDFSESKVKLGTPLIIRLAANFPGLNRDGNFWCCYTEFSLDSLLASEPKRDKMSISNFENGHCQSSRP